MTASASNPPPVTAQRTTNVFFTMLPVTLALFVGFLTFGAPLPVLPLHVHDTLGMGTFVVGVLIGAHFAAALLTRAWAGTIADTRGPRLSVAIGFICATLAGLTFLVSLLFLRTPELSVGILILGRILSGLAESLVVTGALSWGVALVGPQNAGKAMVWVGIAMYGAYGAGAPVGMAVDRLAGFTGIALAMSIIPLLALAIVAFAPRVPSHATTHATRRAKFTEVLASVWLPGLGLACCSAGFGVIMGFISLLFAARGWGSASLAFTAFGAAFIGVRLPFGHLPDKIGGAKVALVCVLIEAVGQLLIWDASSVYTAYLGAALTGIGYSMAFPGFGVEAVRRAPPQSRGAALGTYVAFFDISLGVTGPVAGAIAHAYGIGTVYLACAGLVTLSAVAAIYLLASPQAATRSPVAVKS
jgi:MFS family permease